MTDKQWQVIEDELDRQNASFEYHKANDKKAERVKK
jgi:hypothetical protein